MVESLIKYLSPTSREAKYYTDRNMGLLKINYKIPSAKVVFAKKKATLDFKRLKDAET